MIRIGGSDLPREAADMLRSKQAALDEITVYEQRVTKARTAWKNRDHDRFAPVREVLRNMCAGNSRCMYCEDSAADEIEHVRPKSLYPEQTFVWENFLFACGRCNGAKKDQFGVLSATRRQFVDVTRGGRGAVVPPEAGRMMLIDPRREDPLRFLQLDLVWPFWFHPRAQRNCLAFARATYTIEVLKLNHRDTLLNARESAYRSYRAHLTEYLEARDKRAAADHLQQLVDAFQRMNQLTVWREMQRQQGQIPELRALFERAPEALSW